MGEVRFPIWVLRLLILGAIMWWAFSKTDHTVQTPQITASTTAEGLSQVMNAQLTVAAMKPVISGQAKTTLTTKMSAIGRVSIQIRRLSRQGA